MRVTGQHINPIKDSNTAKWFRTNRNSNVKKSNPLNLNYGSMGISDTEYENIKYNIEFQNRLRELKFKNTDSLDSTSTVAKVKNSIDELKNDVQKINDLAKSAYDKDITSNDRIAIQNEIELIKKNIDKISNSDEFKNFSSLVEKFENGINRNHALSADKSLSYDLSILKSISGNSVESLGLEDINVYNDENIYKSINMCKNAMNILSNQYDTLERYQDVLLNIEKNSESMISIIDIAKSKDELINMFKSK